jgi:hypothetical protein
VAITAVGHYLEEALAQGTKGSDKHIKAASQLNVLYKRRKALRQIDLREANLAKGWEGT